MTCDKGSAGARILASGCHSTPITSAEAWLYLASVQLLDAIGDYLILADQARRFLAVPRTISISRGATSGSGDIVRWSTELYPRIPALREKLIKVSAKVVNHNR